MDALRSAMNDPARPWYHRLADFSKVTAALGADLFATEPTTAIAMALAKYTGVLGAELIAKGDRRANLKRSGLYYLLSLERMKARSVSVRA
jgi:hypothetical protein